MNRRRILPSSFSQTMVTMTSHPSKIDAQAALMALGGRKAAEDAGLLQKEDSTTTVPKPEGVRKLANVSLNFPQRVSSY